MDQKTKHLYELDPGEVVHVRLVPTGVTQHFVSAALDGEPLPHSPSGNLDFEFVFPGDESLLQIAADFVSPQPDSRYDIFLRVGNEEEKNGPTIDQTKKVVAIKFRTRTGPPK